MDGLKIKNDFIAVMLGLKHFGLAYNYIPWALSASFTPIYRQYFVMGLVMALGL